MLISNQKPLDKK